MYWVQGGVVDDTQDDAAVFGIEIPDPKPEYFEVEPEAWPAVKLFLRCQTQWRTGPNGVVGLDYNALAWLVTIGGDIDAAAMLDDIQVIEQEVLAALSKKGG